MSRVAIIEMRVQALLHKPPGGSATQHGGPVHKTRPVRLGIYSAPVSGTLRVIFCGQLVARKSLITIVALTGIERANFQFSSAQLSLNQCKYLQIRSVRMPRPAKNAPQSAGVPARCQRGHSEVGPESRADAAQEQEASKGLLNLNEQPTG